MFKRPSQRGANYFCLDKYIYSYTVCFNGWFYTTVSCDHAFPWAPICSITAPGLVALCITPPRRCSHHFSHLCKCAITHHPDLVETRRHLGLGGHKTARPAGPRARQWKWTVGGLQVIPSPKPTKFLASSGLQRKRGISNNVEAVEKVSRWVTGGVSNMPLEQPRSGRLWRCVRVWASEEVFNSLRLWGDTTSRCGLRQSWADLNFRLKPLIF